MWDLIGDVAPTCLGEVRVMEICLITQLKTLHLLCHRHIDTGSEQRQCAQLEPWGPLVTTCPATATATDALSSGMNRTGEWLAGAACFIHLLIRTRQQ